jgi:hypothetical protein
MPPKSRTNPSNPLRQGTASTSPMFQHITDDQTTFSVNRHSEADYEHPRSRFKPAGPPHLMRDSANQVYWDEQPLNLSHRVKDQVLTQIGQRVGTMTFQSELDGERR